MTSPYENRFWKKNWDDYVHDLNPEEFDTTVVDLFEASFKEFPTTIALVFFGVEINFEELEKYSNQFANMLVANNFRKGDIVGINLPNTPQFVIAVIGALKAGCIVSGVSPLLSTVQLHHQLTDLGSTGKKIALLTLESKFTQDIVKLAEKIKSVTTVITTRVDRFQPNSEDLIRSYGEVPEVKVIPLNGKNIFDFFDILEEYSPHTLSVEISPDDIGWIQYTGGTTGPPKGAMLTHKNRVSNYKSFGEWLKWEKGKDIMLSAFPFFHIGGLNTCELCLYYATTQLLILNARDTDYVIKLLDKYHPTIMSNVPSFYQILMNKQKFKEMDYSKLHLCISAASPFPKESQKELEHIIGKNKLLELFGMTELSPVATMNPYLGNKKLGTIGLPIQNIELKIVDPITEVEIHLGEIGEILVSGPLVMRGYHNKPEETKNAIDEDGYMHTGDVGMMDEDGYITIVDRTKDMIIVGGFKVFSSKVEDILSKHPAIGMIALIGIPNQDRPGSEIVKAYVQIHPDYKYNSQEDIVREEIIKFAKENCSPYEVPKIIEFVEELPLTPVGKIDKKFMRTLQIQK